MSISIITYLTKKQKKVNCLSPSLKLNCYLPYVQRFMMLDAGTYTPAAPLKDLLSRINEDTNQLLIKFRKKKQQKWMWRKVVPDGQTK